MRYARPLRIAGVAGALSTAAPAVLAANGVVDCDVLLVVFLPSVLVGLATAWYAHRQTCDSKAWAYDSRRMP